MLRHFLKISIPTIFAIVLFSVLTHISPVFALVLNIFNLLVLYFAFEEGEIYGAVTGSVFGLIQDSFSMGVFGIAGFSKTIMGFLAGYISRRINVVPSVRRAVFIFTMLVLEVFLWMFLYSFAISKAFYTAKGWLFMQPVFTTVLAFIVFPLLKKLNKVLLKHG